VMGRVLGVGRGTTARPRKDRNDPTTQGYQKLLQQYKVKNPRWYLSGPPGVSLPATEYPMLNELGPGPKYAPARL